MLTGLIASGRLIDLILLLVVIEAAMLAFWRFKAARSPHAVPLLANLAAGAALLLALGAALRGSDAMAIALWLTLGLIAHLLDLVLRFRDRDR